MIYFTVVYYRTNDLPTIRKIQERFNFPKYMTVNGECPVVVNGKDWELLKETEKRGFIQIRNKTIRIMKATELFIKRIEDYLKKEADADQEFAKRMNSQRRHPRLFVIISFRKLVRRNNVAGLMKRFTEWQSTSSMRLN